MLNLPEITLIALTGRAFGKHKKAVERSCRKINFGAVKIVYDAKIKTIDDWNRKIVFELTNYVNTPYCLLIHADGYVVNPESWREEWLEYDFIGAPWPLPTDDFSYRDEEGNIVRVGNSVSLRSKKLLDAPTKLGFEWKSYFGNTNEDGFLTCHHRITLEKIGCRFAPLEVAKYFSRETDIPENADVNKPFCFHFHKSQIGRNKEFIC